MALSHDISGALSVISDFHAVLDLAGSGADLPPNATKIVISSNGRVRSEIPILTHERILECVTVTTNLYLSAVSFVPPPVTECQYCSDRPDTDFDGNGPCVWFDLTLWVDAAGKVLSATIFMDAWESKDDFSTIHHDHTEAVGTKTVELFRAGDNETITGFDVNATLHEQYIDSNTNPDIRVYTGLEPASKIEFIGDTDDDEAGSETGATISFRPIAVKLERCEYK